MDENINNKLVFPPDFLECYEPLECFSHNQISETYQVKSLETGELFVAKIYDRFFITEGVDEQAILAVLDHPAVPKLIESFETTEVVCIVRSYAAGRSLDTLDVPVGQRFVLNVGIQLCDILTYLHMKEPPIIHRDIKPQNVVITDERKVSLIDFGIARWYKEDAERDTRIFASDGFAPPEQFGFGQTDNQTDIYSLGMVLCWLLTGTNEIIEIDIINNRELARVIKKCTEFAPKDRYKDAETVKQALIKANRRKNYLIPIFFTAAVLLFTSGFIFGRITAPIPELLVETELPADDVKSPDVTEEELPEMGGESPVIASGTPTPGDDTTEELPLRTGLFKEALVEEAVRFALGKAEDETILPEELDEITALYFPANSFALTRQDFHNQLGEFFNGNIDNGEMECLSDFSLMKNLEELGIAFHLISDASPISENMNLMIVYFLGCSLTDASSFVSLSNLKELNLVGNYITDARYFAEMPSLERLSINSLTIKSISELGYIPKLDVLGLDGTSSLENLEGIEKFKRLSLLYISNTNVKDFSHLNNMPWLGQLTISKDMEQYLDTLRRDDINVVVN